MAFTALLGVLLTLGLSLVATGRVLGFLQWMSAHVGLALTLAGWGTLLFGVCVGVPIRLAVAGRGNSLARRILAAIVLWNGALTGLAAYMGEQSLWQSAKLGLQVTRPQPSAPGRPESPKKRAPLPKAPAVYPKPTVPGAALSEPAFGWKEPDKVVEGKDAESGLGQWMLLGQASTIGRPEFREKWEKIEQDAKSGGPEARLKLGALLCNGTIVKRDGPAGLYWMHRAAKEGSIEAMFQLGRLFRGHDCAKEDYSVAAAWFHEAAVRKHVPAMRELSWFVLNGQGMPASQDGLDWLHQAAEAGDGEAMSTLGSLYDLGSFAEPDKAEARKWYAKAAALCGPYCYAQERLDILDGKRPAEIKPSGPATKADPDFDPAKMVLGLYGGMAKAGAAAEAAGKERAFAFWRDDLVGHAVPELAAETISGRAVDVKSLKGKAVWLTFGATSCPGTKSQADGQGPWIRNFGDDASFVTVLSPKARDKEASAKEALTFAKDHGLTADAVWLADRFTLRLGHGPTPRHVFVDPSGVVRAALGGNLTEEAARAALSLR